jgi:cation diffusion facilitator family transporter
MSAHEHHGRHRHSHDVADKIDSAMETNRLGVHALKISVLILGLTATIQVSIVMLSGSVALLGDTLHNVADALTAIPLGLAFWVGRRRASKRYTYGYGRAEDLAGVAIVLTIAASSVAAGWEAVSRLLHPRDIHYVGAVIAASIIGFLGNELVAHYRIRVGRRIGSAALVADGVHARTDGLTSLAVLVGAIGAAAGFRLADPIVGLLITVAIAVLVKGAARDVFRRLMDGVDPHTVDHAEATLRSVPGVEDVGQLRIRWVGHSLWAEAEITVDHSLTVGQAHGVTEAARHDLLHHFPRLTSAIVHADPSAHDGVDHHAALAHHDRP